MLSAVVLALTFLNAVTFVHFGADKRRAQAGLRRVPEANLLRLALLGGTPAAYLARHHYRHKTRKQPFSTYLAVIAMVQGGVVCGVSGAIAYS